MAPLNLIFDNSSVRELPGDRSGKNYPRQVHDSCYSLVAPTPVSAPRLLAHAAEVADLLDLSAEACASQEFADVFAGNLVLEGMTPTAACYGGHQFGHWAGQLGDGRAISLGEVKNGRGERWEIQLKGAGPTPYSRSADGRAVTRSSVREFLCSEAMHHLGVPTTRALSLVGTGDAIVRDMFYDGNPRPEPGAVVCRVAPSFLRFGSYEIFSARREHEPLRTLADYTIRTHFPQCGEPGKDAYLAWLEEVCRTTALMIVDWMRVGFVHGVLNTDNMSILGLTIDYGPYGWLDDFDPNWTPNTTDAVERRYRFCNQAEIGLWNLARLANSISPLVGEPGPLESALDVYRETFRRAYRQMMNDKLGLEEHREGDDELVANLLASLQLVETDMTIFYRRLADLQTTRDRAEDELLAPFLDASYALDEWSGVRRERALTWLHRYIERLRAEARSDDLRRTAMNAVNPRYVLRNYVAQLAIEQAEQGDGTLVRRLLEVMRRPYEEQRENEAEFGGKRPEWARDRAGCSMLS